MLEGRGVDLFMVETFFDLADLETAVAAIRSVSSLPIVALMTFDSDGETLARRLGARGGRAAARRSALAAFGANHGAGPAAALRALAEMRGDGDVLAALPNVGLASMSGQRIVFPHATPAYFGEFAAQARALGAGIIGGCCGTTPAQIAAIRAAIDENLAPSGSVLVRERELAAHACAVERADAARSGCSTKATFVVSVQLDPPLGANPEALLATARAVRESNKAQFVDVNDNPRARARMSGIMASRRDRALHRRRDDPAPDAARHDGRRARVDPARRRTRRACATSSPSPATRRSRATIPARTACTTSTRSGSSS